ncbi:MAG: hypothetical protein IPH11_13120 [Ignavibacteriales bacterium]|nr:hypothetical protein [Ignavibacteriales bacterium]
MHAGVNNICTNSIDCSIRSLWKTVQTMLDGLLCKITLQDLLGNEQQVELFVTNLSEELDNENQIKIRKTRNDYSFDF